MTDRYFLDTNIFVYSVDKSSPAKAERASQLIRDALTEGRGLVSYQVVQEFFNVALNRFARPLAPAEAEQYLTTIFKPLLAVHSSVALCGEALRLVSRYRLSWYDSLIVAAAIESRCQILYTEDLQHGQRIADLHIQNPFWTA